MTIIKFYLFFLNKDVIMVSVCEIVGRLCYHLIFVGIMDECSI